MGQTSPTESLSYPASALTWCGEVTKQHSQTFYLGSLLYPSPQREAVWAVYAACRVGDDIADSPYNAVIGEELEAWWHDIQQAYAGHAGQTQMQQALAWAVARYPIPLSAFEELYQGFCMDLRGATYQTLEDLHLYCRRVAGVVGFMIAPIGGYSGGERTLDAALSLGKAMQLTNILRDVGEDWQLGRVYLPAELLGEYGVGRADLQAGRVTPEYRALMRHLSALAREWYAAGREGIPALRGRARYGVSYAAHLYEGILDELEKNDFDNFSQRAYVSGKRKAWLLLKEIHAANPRPDLCPLGWAGRQYGRLRAWL